jgi:hypothetical protein
VGDASTQRPWSRKSGQCGGRYRELVVAVAYADRTSSFGKKVVTFGRTVNE